METPVLFDNEHFILWRMRDITPFKVGFKNEPVILVCVEGNGKAGLQRKKLPDAQRGGGTVTGCCGRMELSAL